MRPDQLESCRNQPDDESCTVGTRAGVCVDQVCLERGCGDLRVGGAEQCDGDRFINDATDCLGLGFYENGPIACNNDCTADVSQCRAFCGDEVLQSERELCEPSLPDQDRTCASLGFYQDGPAPCSLFCNWDVSGCRERCGDGVINGPEVCEPATGIPSHLSCLELGFDTGVLECSGACAPDFASCQHFGLFPVATASMQMRDVYATGPSSAIVVGNTLSAIGVMLRFDGTNLVPIALPAGADFTAVHGSSPTHVIAVGSGGRIVRYDGNAATEMTSPTTTFLQGVHVRTDSDAWAVGSNGTIIRYNGASWSLVAAPASNLNAVWAASATDAWAVGQAGRILRFTGSNWSTVTSPTTADLHAVWGTSSSNIYAVGIAGVIVHYNGQTWSTMASPTPGHLFALHGTGADDIIAAGASALVHFNGTRWVNLETSVADYRGASIVDARHGFVADSSGRLMRWEGAGWSPSATMPLTAFVSAAWGTSATNIYAASPFDVLRYNGSTWASAAGAPSGSTVRHVAGIAANNIVAVGDFALHYNGNEWTPGTLPPEANGEFLVGVWGTAPNIYFAISDGGLVLRYDGNVWTLHTTLGTSGAAIWGASATDIWAVGGGKIFRSNGVTWNLVDEDNTRTYNAVWGTSATNVYAVGVGGVVVHYDGVDWQTVPVPTTRTLYAIHGTGPNDIFVAGDGTLLHFNGTTWYPVDTRGGTARALWTTASELQFITTNTSRTLVRACPTCL